jgi:glycosyltransferase involved in cell wall biosynthesis
MAARVRYRWVKYVLRPLFRARTGVLRRRALRRLGRLEPGVTVVAVSFNSGECAETLVRAVRRFSPSDVRIIIVDNASSEPLPEWLAGERGVELVRLPGNFHHGPAMDLGVLKVGTTHFVAMDIDAFPIREGWLEMWLEPLHNGARVSGAHMEPGMTLHDRDYVHPCCLAMRTSTFVLGRHTFAPGSVGGAPCDTGQQISEREPAQHYIDLTSQRGPGAVGSVFGDAVYHNFYATRFHGREVEVLDGIIEAGDARLAWVEAISRYLGPEAGSSEE